MKKAPFVVIDEFISPLLCERILYDLRIDRALPMKGQDGKPKPTILASRLNSDRIIQNFDRVVSRLEENFNTEYLGTHNLMFEWYPENYQPTQIKTDGYMQTREQGWVKYNLIDFTGILWLNDYNDKPNFDPNFEVNGGTLEFPTFDIKFKPSRGTLVLFPTAPNFANTVAAVNIGTLTQVRLQIRSTEPYKFNIDNFETDPANWNI